MAYAIALSTLGWTLAGFALMMLVPAFVAFGYAETDQAWTFLVSAGLTLFSGGALVIATRGTPRSPSQREAFALAVLVWLVLPLFGALPFFYIGVVPTVTDAYFEAMSGLTTTGATVLNKLEIIERSVLTWRALLQWLGGLATIMLTVVLLSFYSVGAMKLFRSAMPRGERHDLRIQLVQSLQAIWWIYLALTSACALSLFLAGLGIFESICLAMSTLSTGGFSIRDGSLASFSSPAVESVLIVFMLAAGVNFSLYFRLGRGGLRVLVSNVEFRVYLAIAAAAVLVVTLTLYGSVYDSVIDSLRYGAFQVVSILTTTGFTTADYGRWPEFAKAVLMALMFVGGCAGSTAGGIKVVRIITLFKLAANEMRYLIHPRGVFPTRVTARPLKKDIIHPIVTFFFLYIAILIVTMLVVAAAGTDLLSSFSTALSTVGNIGPGFGAIGPAEHYGHYPAGVKLFLCLAMLTGRLELYSVVVLLTPAFWRK